MLLDTQGPILQPGGQAYLQHLGFPNKSHVPTGHAAGSVKGEKEEEREMYLHNKAVFVFW